jgi:hypothetical protein
VLHQLPPFAAPYAGIEARLDFVSRKPVKFGEQLASVHGHGSPHPASTASPCSDKLINQPHACRSDHQARANQQEGSYPLSADYLCCGQGKPSEQYCTRHEEGEGSAQHQALY